MDGGRAYRVAVSSLSAGGFNSFDALAAGSDRADGPADTAAMEAHLAPSLSGEPRVPPATDRITRGPLTAARRVCHDPRRSDPA